MHIASIQKEIHDIAKAKGWWDNQNGRPIGEIFANFHSEISEAWEEYRKGIDIDYIYTMQGKPEGVPNYYEVSRCRKNDELYGKIHKALNDKNTVFRI